MLQLRARAPGIQQLPMGGKSERGAIREIADAESVAGRVVSADADPPSPERVAAGGTPADPVENRPANGKLKRSVDPELLRSFFEESAEIVRAIDRNVLGWASEPDNLLYRQNLLECLHTLKGGAQLCALHELGDLVHRLEGFLVEIQVSNARVVAGALRELRTHRSRLAQMLKLASRPADMYAARDPALKACASVPFSQLLSRLKAVVQLVADTVGKLVQFRTDTEGVELNGAVLRRLAMPLEHVLCNAVTHGIESPERRRAGNKSATGWIDLHAEVQGRDLVIEIEDDGRGIDAAQVRDQAMAGGTLAKDACLHAAQTAQFVFAPGISTAQNVSRTYGRGIGLSAAQAGVSRLWGCMEACFRPGRGASFRVRMAREAWIQRALLFSVRNDRYAIADSVVDEVVPVTPRAMEKLTARGAFEYRGVSWELCYLPDLLGYRSAERPGSDDSIVLLAACGERRLALHVDAAGERCDVLVRRSKDSTSHGGVASLATLLDDGGLVVILEPRALPGAERGARTSAV